MTREIIVGVDDSDGARHALAWAVDTARSRGAAVAAVHVVAPLQVRMAELGLTEDERERVERTMRVRAEEEVARIVADVPHDGVAVTPATIVDQSVSGALIHRARRAELLVVGSRGHGGFSRLRLGSVGRQTAQHARCPVVVVPSAAPPRTDGGPVIVGIDGSRPAGEALRFAAREARLRDAELEVVVVQDPPPPSEEASAAESSFGGVMWVGLTPLASTMSEDERRERRAQITAVWRAAADRAVDDAVAELDEEDRPRRIRREVVADRHPARTLIAMTETAQLLVLGARGGGGFSGLGLGSVSQQCITHASCPVMVVRRRR